MELGVTNLKDYFTNSDNILQDLEKIEICIQIAKALNYIHFKKVIYKDLKSLNIVRRENGEWFIIDFGIAKEKVAIHTVGQNTKTGSFSGTIAWSAPELFNDEDNGMIEYNFKTDVYSLGIVFQEIANRQTPWAKVNAAMCIRKKFLGQEEAINENTPTALKDLIEKCRSASPADRPLTEIVVEILDQEIKKMTPK